MYKQCPQNCGPQACISDPLNQKFLKLTLHIQGFVIKSNNEDLWYNWTKI